MLDQQIQMLRKQKGLSQEQLADKLDLSRQSISKWELGQSIPEIDKIILMSKFFGVSTDFLLTGEDKVKEKIVVKKMSFGKKIIIALLSICLIAGMFTGGYFWGKELNKQIINNEPSQNDDPLINKPKEEKVANFSDVLSMRNFVFDFAVKNRFDYVPFFQEGKAPTDSSEYLFYVFVIRLNEWGENKGTMSKAYVEGTIKEHFDVSYVNHVPLFKGWDFDGEKYTAVPGGIAEEPIYILKKYETYIENGKMIYQLTLDHCNMANGSIPSQKDIDAVKENIARDDLSKLTVLKTETFKICFDDKGDFEKENDTLKILSHQLVE